nr:insulinase family protein [Actinomycetota bacterium]
ATAKISGRGEIGIIYKKIEQANLLLGVPSVDRNDPRRFAVAVLNSALGGGMSSRLFQEIREKRGLAYSVYSSSQHFAGAGTLSFYAGCNPDKAVEVAAIFREVMADVVANGLSEQEVERAKGQVRGSLVLGQEDTGSRMVRIGKSELVYGEIMSMDQVLAEVASVTREGLFAISKELLTQQPTLAVVGPFKKDHIFRSAVVA